MGRITRVIPRSRYATSNVALIQIAISGHRILKHGDWTVLDTRPAATKYVNQGEGDGDISAVAMNAKKRFITIDQSRPTREVGRTRVEPGFGRGLGLGAGISSLGAGRLSKARPRLRFRPGDSNNG